MEKRTQDIVLLLLKSFRFSASYYPNLAIANKLYPEHLSEQFCDIYEDVYEQRKKFLKKTHPTENGMLKLALNGVYGDSNNKYSPFYDPKYTMTVTLNGQLLLCMLSEWLMEIPEMKMVQINTDGLTVKIPRKHLDDYHNICKKWEQLTGLELEFAEYSRMFTRDVNSYIAEYADGGLKRIGSYEWKMVEDGGRLGWHQNRSCPVVAFVAEKALVYGIDIPTMVRNHPNDLDFMLRTKVKRSNILQALDDAGNVIRELQRITRYAVTTNGFYLNKLAPPHKGAKAGTWKRKQGVNDAEYKRVMDEIKNNPHGSTQLDIDGVPWDERINTKNGSMNEDNNTSINSGYRVADCNDLKHFNRNDLNYDFYINEVNKLVESLVNGSPM